MARLNNHRVKSERPDFIQLESNTANFRLLLETAPTGSSTYDRRTQSQVRAAELPTLYRR